MSRRGYSHLVSAASAIILLVVLFHEVVASPIVGLANNGDFYRIAPQSGVYYINGGGPETFDPESPGYVSRLYRTGAIKNPQGYYSSGLVMMWAARLANDLVRRDELFDIRFLGAVHSCCFAAAIFFFLTALSKLPLSLHVIAASLTLFTVTDVGYFSYFNSFYSESASAIYLFAAVGALMSTSRLADASFVGFCVLFLTAKPQNAVLAPVLVLTWALLRARHKKALLPAGLLLCAFAFVYLSLSPFKQVNRYNHVFHGILEEDPEALRGFGLGEEYATLVGTHWWSPLEEPDEQLKQSTVERLRYRDIVEYYLRHPSRFGALWAKGAAAAFVFRPAGLGNFERSRGGPPGEMSEGFGHWTTVKTRVFPETPGFQVLAGLAIVTFSALVWRFRVEARKPAILLLGLVGMCAVQFFAVLVGGGHVELVRHLFLVNVLVDLMLVVLVVVIGVILPTSILRGRRGSCRPWIS